jgi:hypothetical protein
MDSDTIICGQRQYVRDGLCRNAAYDYFPCQFQLFYRGKGGMWYDPVFQASSAGKMEPLQLVRMLPAQIAVRAQRMAHCGPMQSSECSFLPATAWALLRAIIQSSLP